MHLHTVNMAYAECLPTRLNPLAERTYFSQVWGQDYMEDYRKRYGEEYTPERYRQMEIDGAKEQVFVKEDPADKSIVTINNDDFENFSSIAALNKLVGLEWEEVDAKKIAGINMKRMENLNLDM
jgi:hypothetical protein